MKKYKLKGKLWVYPGDTPWHFLTVGKKESSDISKEFGRNTRGFGSLPVAVVVGKTSWETSIFPDKKSGTFLLPVKASVRKAEDMYDGDSIVYSIEIKA